MSLGHKRRNKLVVVDMVETEGVLDVTTAEPQKPPSKTQLFLLSDKQACILRYKKHGVVEPDTVRKEEGTTSHHCPCSIR
jgi:hypothetical protein